MLKKFNYEKADGSISPRTVYEVSNHPDDCMLAIDVSEFSQPERDEFEGLLRQIHNEYLDAIEQIGLGNNWRLFKHKGITPRKGV